MDTSTLYMKDHLVTQIEKKLGWGNGQTWSNKDFEELSELIFSETNKKLSVTTLKRIWGRAERIANPSAATLNILSEFAGYENWRVFVQVNNNNQDHSEKTEKSIYPKKWILLLLALIVTILLFFGWQVYFNNTEKTPTYNPEDFSFESRPVSKGLPNSVVFEYDARAADKNSKVEIQQDWDRNKRSTVSRNDSIATSIYYRPGFFRSKLVVDDTILKRDNVFIPTDGWLGMIERDKIPIYLKKEEYYADGQLKIDNETVLNYNLDPRTAKVAVSFYQVRDFGELYTDNFEMSTTLKNTFDEGISTCQHVDVYLLYEGGAIGIPMAKKGCSSKLELLTFKELINGKNNDLSGFGIDFNDYAELKLISKDKKLDIFINGDFTHQMHVPENPAKIKGLIFYFEGAGEIREVVFKKNEEIIYKDDFPI